MRILHVEDDPDMSTMLKRSLEEACFAVDTAKDGEEGLSLARDNNYDLIILDNNLPQKNGIEVCREIRAAGKTVPILMLSVRSETSTKSDLLNAGADDYLTKPFSFDELLARIRAILRRPQQIQGDLLVIDTLRLDIGKHACIRSKEKISLTRKEFMLLAYLMRNTGTILSRNMIMEHVWDVHADPFSNTIESHIVSLRKKIDLPGEHKLIHTIPGFGYKISTEK